MKRNLKWILLISLLMVFLSACGGGAAAPSGEPIITISGELGATNADDNFDFDEAMFSENKTELVINDPWLGDGLKYSGMTLASILEVVKAPDSATTMTIVARDGFELEIPIEDAQNMDILLVHWNDGKALSDDDGGPVKLAFSEKARETYLDDEWIWWVEEVKIK